MNTKKEVEISANLTGDPLFTDLHFFFEKKISGKTQIKTQNSVQDKKEVIFSLEKEEKNESKNQE